MFPNETQILIVDDMSAMRMRVSNQLKAMGFVNIEQAENGQEAFDKIEKMQTENKPVQLIISDWNMPIMSGLDFLLKVRAFETYAKLSFVMVTAEGEKPQVIKALKSGVSDYLIKPVDKELLQQKLLGVWNKINLKT